MQVSFKASVHCEHQSELPALIQEKMENFGEKKEKMENFGEKKEKARSGRSLEERRTTALEQIAASTNSLVLYTLSLCLNVGNQNISGHVDDLLCDGGPHLCHRRQEDHLAAVSLDDHD